MTTDQTTIDALADVVDADKCRAAFAMQIATGIHNTAIRAAQDAIAALPVNPHAVSYQLEVIATLQGLIK